MSPRKGRPEGGEGRASDAPDAAGSALGAGGVAESPAVYAATRASALPLAPGKAPGRMLLDVNVWIALFDDAHVFSARANALLDEPGLRIATCPLTENGAIRIMSLPAYGNRGGLAPARVRAQLRGACEALDHEFWPDGLSMRDDAVFDFDRLQGPQQLTDAYLLALAVAHDGVLVSFDQKVALQAVRGAQARHLRLL